MATDAAKGGLIQGHVLRNTLANYAGQIVTLIVGLFLTPFVLGALGSSYYGLVALVGSLTAYGTLFDFGISGAVIKYVAEYTARGEYPQARSLIATALRLYTALGLALIALSAAIAPLIPDLFHLTGVDHATAVTFTLLSGISIGIGIPCATPVAVLRGLQRFDLVNIIGTVGTLLVTAATVAALLLGWGVIGMAAVTIPLTLLMQVPALWLVRRVAPELRVGWRGARRADVGIVIGYSSSIFMAQVSARLQTKTDELVIGMFLPLAAVTPYALARRLSEIVHLLTQQFLKVLLPLASQLNAENDHARLRALYLTSTRLALAIFVPVGGTLSILAGAALTAWVGPQYAPYGYLVVILTLAGFLDTLLWPASSILQGMGHYAPLALIAVGAAIANLILSLALVRPLGLAGVALGTLIPTTISSLTLALPYTMRRLRLRPAELLREVFLPTLLPALPMGLALYALGRLVTPTTLPALAFVGGCGVLIYLGVYLVVGAGEPERAALRHYVGVAVARAQAAARRS